MRELLMKIMTPKEYFSFIHEVLFHAIALVEQVISWDKRTRLRVLLQSSIYSLIVGVLLASLTCLSFMFLSGKLCSEVLCSAVVLVCFEVLLGVLLGMGLGIGLGIILDSANGVVLGVALSAALSVMIGISSGIVIGLNPDVKIRVAAGIPAAISGGISYGACTGIGLIIYKRGSKNVQKGTVYGVVFGIIFGIMFAHAFGIYNGLVFGIITGFFTGIAASSRSVIGELFYGLFLGLVLGLVFGIYAAMYFSDKSEGAFMGVPMGVAFEVSFILFLFLFLGRYFYYPRYIYLLVRKGDLKKSSICRDENIGLPIPFLSRILLKQASHDLTAAVECSLLLLQKRKVLRKQAQMGLVLIALEEMHHFITLKNIASLKKILAFLPESIEEMGTLFHKTYPSFLKISQKARLICRETNAANRYRLLERLHSKILELQKSFDFSSNRNILPYSNTLLKWKSIVEAEIKRMDESGQRPLPNPFITGIPIHPEDGELFVGRQDIVDEIQTEILRPTRSGAILFLGSRRSGKTSTLLNLEGRISSHIKPVFIDFQDAMVNSSIEDFCMETAGAIGEALNDQVLKEKEVRTPAELTKLLKALQSKLARRDEALLLCFDEYERIGAPGTSLGILPDLFRHWVQQIRNVFCLFSGAHHLSQIKEVDWSDYLINCRVVLISYLDSEAALKLVTAPIPRFDLVWEPAELAHKVIGRLGCQPYLLQVFMFELTELLNRECRKTANGDDVEGAIEKLFQSAENYLSNFWKSELLIPEREVLLALAKDLPLPDNSGVTVKSLIHNKEVLAREEDRYVFRVPLIKEWIRNRF